jgi:hypothetical protein
MKRKLRLESLESREVPAAGTSLTTIAVGPQYTLSVNSSGRVAVMQMADPEWNAFRDGSQSQAQNRALTQRIYQSFGDDFDVIMAVANLPDVTGGLFGFNATVKNTVTGTGHALQNDTALWGSAGKLQNFIWVGSEQDMYRRTILHEFLHRDAAFLSQLGTAAYGAHWGFSSVGGQLGGWAPGTLRQIGPGEYDADSPAGTTDWYPNYAAIYDGHVPYSQLELYMLGLIDYTQLDPIQYATNGAFTDITQGQFSADSIQTLTPENIVAQEGLRNPTPLTSQKNYRVLTVVLTPNPLTQGELDQYDTNVELFGRAGSDGDPTVLNFWEATGGRASLTMDGLADYLPARTPVLGVGTAGRAEGYVVGTSGKYDTLSFPNLGAYLGVNPGESIRTAVGDVNGDKIPDYAITTGAGSLTRFAVVNGAGSGYIIPPSAPFPGSEDFAGGAFISVGDLDGDGRSDVVLSADVGGGPRVTVYSHKPNVGTYKLTDFFGIADAAFRGGARTAVGDMNQDGRADLAVAAGPGGGPRVAIYNGGSLFTTRGKLVPDFFAFPGSDAVNLRNGVYLSIGDLNGDSYGDLVFGAGTGGSPRVLALNGQTLVTRGSVIAGASPIADFFSGSTADRGGVRVAVKNVDDDQRMDIVTGSGVGVAGNVKVYKGSGLRGRAQPPVFQSLDVFTNEGFNDGVYVG